MVSFLELFDRLLHLRVEQGFPALGFVEPFCEETFVLLLLRVGEAHDDVLGLL